MGASLSVRAAEGDDLPRIAELEDIVFEGTGFTFSTLMQLFGPSGVAWLVAEDSEGIWGYSLSMRDTDDPQVGWLLALGVHPERRGLRIGLRLLDESIAWLQSKGANAIKVTVKPENWTAYDMYIRAGFQDTGQWKDGDLGDGQGRKMLTLLLPTP
ncbi:GNAT family N-acetyltransferase [Catenulispora sp. NF23]|uniref:GNAT family N-acetyltransferase n=1 Tax=Catenulispora pinistramenti TaxID=2705254 RepID=A0ABS5KNM4_9ACTN|nr:N-acetyltransferase [Catenulispora pinistramenti]MBS2531804.1 GNAT family N-acetyltransferase [Catenulispora pinistramenti]MBS2547650.1 GNAT family N-acetyltransferase [Catenulispora pinistramenti]